MQVFYIFYGFFIRILFDLVYCLFSYKKKVFKLDVFSSFLSFFFQFQPNKLKPTCRVPIINCTINSSNFYIKIFFEKQLFSMELIAQQTHLKFNSREKKRKIQKRKKKPLKHTSERKL
jgi:hypothetical protein